MKAGDNIEIRKSKIKKSKRKCKFEMLLNNSKTL